MHSDFQIAIEHCQKFYSSERIQTDKVSFGRKFKNFASVVITKYPEFSKEEKFVQEITRIKGALS